MHLSVDVIVLTHNGWELTARCLESLESQTVAHTVIVCDNGSTDGSPQLVRTTYPRAAVVELGVNLGFAVANNHAVREGAGEVVVLMNNDVICTSDFLEKALRPFERDETIGSVAPLLFQSSEQIIESFGLSVDSTLAGFARFRGLAPDAARRQELRLVGPTGAAAAYRRQAWDDVGGLDEGVFIYNEDLDLALRLRTAGWAAATASDAVAVHVGSATTGVRSSWQRYHGGFSRGYFLRLYGVLRTRHAFRALATEAIVVTGDALVFSHDLAALRGRIAGWRAAAGRPRKAWPPADTIDTSITFLESLRLRFGVYTGRS